MEIMFEEVVVTWRDAFTSDRRQAKEFKRHKIDPCIRRTIGFLIHDDDENIVVCMEDDRGAQDALDSTDDCETVTVIPKGMVVKVDYLTVRRTPPRRETPEPGE